MAEEVVKTQRQRVSRSDVPLFGSGLGDAVDSFEPFTWPTFDLVSVAFELPLP